MYKKKLQGEGKTQQIGIGNPVANPVTFARILGGLIN
jgi:hypothetical protein